MRHDGTGHRRSSRSCRRACRRRRHSDPALFPPDDHRRRQKRSDARHHRRPRGRGGDAPPDRGALSRRTASSARNTAGSAPMPSIVWVLDPIDGTKSFISGIPLFGTLIALTHRGRPVLGVIDQPISRERWVGAAGRPTTLNGAPVRTPPCAGARRRDALRHRARHVPRRRRRGLRAAAQARSSSTRFGADCYAYAQLGARLHRSRRRRRASSPTISARWCRSIEGAGGVITDWQGGPLDLTSDGRVVACRRPQARGSGARQACWRRLNKSRSASCCRRGRFPLDCRPTILRGPAMRAAAIALPRSSRSLLPPSPPTTPRA